MTARTVRHYFMVWETSIWKYLQASWLQQDTNVRLHWRRQRLHSVRLSRRNSDVDTKYKKQSGGHGQYGHVKMRFEPSGDLETPYVFEEDTLLAEQFRRITSRQ